MSPIIDNIDRMVRDVPAMPLVAQKVMHMLGDPRTTNSMLGDTLSSDQSLVTRILQMANSPFFGTRQKIASISNTCLACHGAGIGGAPVFGDAAEWVERIAKGRDTLIDHALQGYSSATGYMPPKGGRLDISDAEVAAAVDYMVDESQ